MKPYWSPNCLQQVPLGELRQVDKTSLISGQSNKYSVPVQYQTSEVFVREEDGWLWIYSPQSNQPIAKHRISVRKGEILKQVNHYRSRQDQIQGYEQTLQTLLGKELAGALCPLLRQSAPEIYKDQLAGLLHILRHYESVSIVRPWLQDLTQRPQLRVSFIRNYLASAMNNPLALPLEETLLSRDLRLYQGLSQPPSTQEVP